MKIPEPIKGFVDSLSQLPGIGPRQAIRIAFYLAGKSKDSVFSLARSAERLGNLKICPQCFFIYENESDICEICSNPTRKKSVIAVVEKETDVLSIENAGNYDGTYFVAGGIKKAGGLTEMQKSRLDSLKKRLAATPGGKAEEIIIALSPTSFGDIASRIIESELSSYAVRITKLGRGIPAGGEVEFADPETLGEAIRRRN
ncbi:MAG: toprim domain-containing protein [Candidatus Colwellbacteria bacterium]|nr:toprim domain-containing protein [Candidatus Colwellbacteria bacterium]